MMRLAALGALFALLAVLAGAFGAHALRARIAPDLLQAFETAVRYQMFHALALLAIGREPGARHALPGGLFVAGILFFSGSLYALALSGMRAWGAVTPVGGLCFLLGWAVLTWQLTRGEART